VIASYDAFCHPDKEAGVGSIASASRYLTSLLFALLRVSYTYQIEETKQADS